MRANSGFPAKHGFGHEEWNGSRKMAFKEDGVAQRAFHTEGVGNEPVGEEAGRTCVFMYASHDGVQELVGIAGNATCLIDDEPQRKTLARSLRLDRLADEAWSVPRVRALHADDRERFDRTWRADLAWIPNWRCPAATFLWLAKPAPLDPSRLRGMGKLLTMFGRHTAIGRGEALAMLESVPDVERLPAWHRIRAEIECPDATTVASDLSELTVRRDIGKTTRKQLVDARLGQGKFRLDLEHLWGGACAVSGCTLSAALRASHIKAWSRSTDFERLDGQNGLLLTADLDALFDRGLISFGDDGQMIVSAQVTKAARRLFRLPRPLRSVPSPRQRRFLAHHRRQWAYAAPP